MVVSDGSTVLHGSPPRTSCWVLTEVDPPKRYLCSIVPSNLIVTVLILRDPRRIWREKFLWTDIMRINDSTIICSSLQTCCFGWWIFRSFYLRCQILGAEIDQAVLPLWYRWTAIFNICASMHILPKLPKDLMKSDSIFNLFESLESIGCL